MILGVAKQSPKVIPMRNLVVSFTKANYGICNRSADKKALVTVHANAGIKAFSSPGSNVHHMQRANS